MVAVSLKNVGVGVGGGGGEVEEVYGGGRVGRWGLRFGLGVGEWG